MRRFAYGTVIRLELEIFTRNVGGWQYQYSCFQSTALGRSASDCRCFWRMIDSSLPYRTEYRSTEKEIICSDQGGTKINLVSSEIHVISQSRIMCILYFAIFCYIRQWLNRQLIFLKKILHHQNCGNNNHITSFVNILKVCKKTVYPSSKISFPLSAEGTKISIGTCR